MLNSAIAYVGLGSNLAQPKSQVQSGLQALAEHPQIRLIAASHWYRSTAVGPGSQPEYVNGAAKLSTQLKADTLLNVLHAVEHTHGRAREQHWAPRTLDLDLLWYDGQTVSTSSLTLPHPRISERNFVLFPLNDIAPELALADGRSVKEAASTIDDTGIWRL